MFFRNERQIISGTERCEYIENVNIKVSRKVYLDFSDKMKSGRFNQIQITYVSDTPLFCTIQYRQNHRKVNDRFYFESGEHTFRGLLNSYDRGGPVSELTTMELVPVGTDSCNVTVCNVETGTVSLRKNIYTLENSRYIVDLNLKWGGGIFSIIDKMCPVNGISNLINHEDQGRLIQQSYYGTSGNDEYRSGKFIDTNWKYNPVQGGDKYRNHSRLIDFSFNENSVYVKCQPQDWSLDGKLTKSYMESTYTLDDDFIRVDNRFVDFSGWIHPVTDQELPAFYTISYLNTFVWYDGQCPWTNDKLTYKHDLGFWGSEEYHDDCSVVVREGNTETWCAWVNDREEYGIGLYVPGINRYLAGRYFYDGSKDPSSTSCSYVAPLNRFKIVSYVPITFSYLIAAGDIHKIRSVFTANKDFQLSTNTDKM